MAGARVVSISESERSQRFAEGLVKQLTGNDAVVARHLFQSEFEFEPEFKLVWATNRKPEIRGVDEGIWRRLHLVPFSETIPPENRDKQLLGKLKAELPGILAWAVRGCLDWQQRGGLEPAKAVIDAVNDYRLESDLIGQFLEDCCEVVNDNRHTTTKGLHDCYETWCEQNGYEPVSVSAFSKQLIARGLPNQRRNKTRGFVGISLKTENDSGVVKRA